MHSLRALALVTAGAALSSALVHPPAVHAADVVTLVCSITYEATTALQVPGSGTCSASGTREGTVTMTLTEWIGPGLLCHHASNAQGMFEGAGLRVWFDWTRWAHTFAGNWDNDEYGTIGSGQGVFVADDPTHGVCDVWKGTPATETAVITLVLL